MSKTKIRSTTILAVRRNGQVAMAGDGQCTLGETVCKGNSRKVRKIYNGKILTGFNSFNGNDYYSKEKRIKFCAVCLFSIYCSAFCVRSSYD